MRFGQRQRDLADRTLQPRQMRGVVDQFAVEHGGHFVDAVGEQKAAVEYRDLGLRKWHERTVDVGDLFQNRVSWRYYKAAAADLIGDLVRARNPPPVVPGRLEEANEVRDCATWRLEIPV